MFYLRDSLHYALTTIMKRPNKLDWAVYRFFAWWWNPILINHPRLAYGMATELLKWLKDNGFDYEED